MSKEVWITDGQWNTLLQQAQPPARNIGLQVDELCQSVLQHGAVNGPLEQESPVGDDIARKHIQVSLQTGQGGSVLC